MSDSKTILQDDFLGECDGHVTDIEKGEMDKILVTCRSYNI